MGQASNGGKDMSSELAKMPDTFNKDGHAYTLRGDRIVRDGTHVAVLVSPGFGAGFTTWCDGVSPYEPKIVAALLADRRDLIANADPEELARELGASYVYLGGVDNLTVSFLPIGTQFKISEYDGSEYIIASYDLPHTA
jgi:hypothetical protein